MREQGYSAKRKKVRSAQRRLRVATDPGYRDKERARRYGLSLDDYRAMLTRQGNACAICRKPNAHLCIDHCHATGRVRGLLCNKCNTGLGCYDDDPGLMEAATAYLKAMRGGGTAVPSSPRKRGPIAPKP